MISDETYKAIQKKANSRFLVDLNQEKDCINAAKKGDFIIVFHADNYPSVPIHLESYITEAQWDIIKKMILENLDIKISGVKKVLENL